MFGTSQAQKKEVLDKENQAQAYAIMSAQYSTDAYLFANRSYFSSNIYTIKQNCDTAISLLQSAIQYADSAFDVAYDTCEYAMTVILVAKDYQLKAIESFKKVKNIYDWNGIHYLSEKSMYAASNAIVEAYNASLFFYWEEGADSLIINEPAYSTADVTFSTMETVRGLVRLEIDEFSYVSIKQLYGKRLVEIEDELALLDEEKKNSESDKLDEINKAIEQLKIEEKECFKKMRGSEDRLISVRNNLSEEMLQIVHKDIFTTDKNDFYNQSIPIPSNSKIPDGLVFKVQIGFFKSQLPPEHFDGIFPLSSQKIDDTYYRYIAGNFPKYNDAKAAKNAIIEKGYADSFVVAYFNGEKISISEALKK